MSNSLSDALNPEYWARVMQLIREKKSVYIKLANMELRAVLQDGDKVNKPYRSDMRPQTYTKGTDISFKDIEATQEYLSVDVAKVVPFYVDDIDKVQNK